MSADGSGVFAELAEVDADVDFVYVDFAHVVVVVPVSVCLPETVVGIDSGSIDAEMLAAAGVGCFAEPAGVDADVTSAAVA